MEIRIEWKETKYPSFNIMVCSKPGKDPFMTIRGCQIKEGKKNNNEFISYPSRKKEDGTYFNHFYGSDDFNAEVLRLAKATQPQAQSRQGSGFDDMKDDIPF